MHRTGTLLELISFIFCVKWKPEEIQLSPPPPPPQIKTGAPCRSERLAKYNQILRLVLPFYRDFSKYVHLHASLDFRGMCTYYCNLLGFIFFNIKMIICFCRIEEELGDQARFAGKNFRNPLNK